MQCSHYTQHFSISFVLVLTHTYSMYNIFKDLTSPESGRLQVLPAKRSSINKKTFMDIIFSLKLLGLAQLLTSLPYIQIAKELLQLEYYALYSS